MPFDVSLTNLDAAVEAARARARDVAAVAHAEDLATAAHDNLASLAGLVLLSFSIFSINLMDNVENALTAACERHRPGLRPRRGHRRVHRLPARPDDAGGELELIFVDDGSTDGTAERLDALAAAHEHVRVKHIPNSGWPGRPRNVGMEMARGEFVYFADNDDWLEPDALERLHAAAVEDAADIVIGKVVGHGKTVPRELFRESHPRQRVHAAAARPADPAQAVPPPRCSTRTASASPRGARGSRTTCSSCTPTSTRAASRCSPTGPYYHWVRARTRRATRRYRRPRARGLLRQRARRARPRRGAHGARPVPRRAARPLVPRQDARAPRRPASPGATRPSPARSSTRSGSSRSTATTRRARADHVQPARPLGAPARRRLGRAALAGGVRERPAGARARPGPP